MSPVVGVTPCSACNSEPPLAGRPFPLGSAASAVLAPLRCCRMASWPTRWGALSARFASLWHTVSAQARPRTWLCPDRPSQCSRTKPPVVRTTAFFGPCLFPVPPYCRPVSGDSSITGSPPRTLLGRVRAAVRARHYSPRTEDAHPKPTHPDYGEVDGAFAAAFVNESIAGAAEAAARAFIEEAGWDVGDPDVSHPVELGSFPPGDPRREHFEQALIRSEEHTSELQSPCNLV